MGKLKPWPPIKSLQEAITWLNPVGPTCIQHTRTHSFRDEAYSSTSSLTSSSISTEPEPSNEESYPPIPKGPITSHRFFFSPHTTKSIMEPAAKSSESGLFEESVRVAMASEDPYRDFRASMEEMVVAHGVREWARLEELLHCYLRLNDRRTHSAIVLAFLDLLNRLVVQEKDVSSPNPSHHFHP